MIYFLTTAKHQYTLHYHLSSYGAALRRFVRPMSYEQLFRTQRLPRGVYIFGDLERLWPDDAERAAKFWQVMNERGGFRTLNHPTRSMRRYELLRTLYLQRANRFNVYRLTELRPPERFPVYLRGENDHDANRTPRLNNAEELAAAIRQVEHSGRSREDTLITEFCDTSDAAGVFHKYSSFCVAGTIVPRHLMFTKHWVVKCPDLLQPEYLEREREYLAANPHESELQRIFAAARIDYGRIDYSLANGALQVWEINTNPTLCARENVGGAAREWLQGLFAEKLQAALESLDSPSVPRLSRAIRVDPRDPMRVKAPKTIGHRIKLALRIGKWRR